MRLGQGASALIAVVFAAVMVWSTAGMAAEADAVPRMTKEELKGLLGRADVVVLDVRPGAARASNRIAGSVYEDPQQVSGWSEKYSRDGRIVLYCA